MKVFEERGIYVNQQITVFGKVNLAKKCIEPSVVQDKNILELTKEAKESRIVIVLKHPRLGELAFDRENEYKGPGAD